MLLASFNLCDYWRFCRSSVLLFVCLDSCMFCTTTKMLQRRRWRRNRRQVGNDNSILRWILPVNEFRGEQDRTRFCIVIIAQTKNFLGSVIEIQRGRAFPDVDLSIAQPLDAGVTKGSPVTRIGVSNNVALIVAIIVALFVMETDRVVVDGLAVGVDNVRVVDLVYSITSLERDWKHFFENKIYLLDLELAHIIRSTPTIQWIVAGGSWVMRNSVFLAVVVGNVLCKGN